MREAPKVIAASLAILAVAYVGLYLALVEARPLPVMMGAEPWPRWARYRVGGEAAELFFWPIQKVDTLIRKRHWQYYDEDDFRS